MTRRGDAPQVVRVWKLQHRPENRMPRIVRWVVDGKPHSRSFATKPPAERYRSRLITAHDNGEAFDRYTGEPESWHPQGAQTPVYAWARTYLADQWEELAPRTRDSYVEALSRFVPLAVAPDAPEPPQGIWVWLGESLRPHGTVTEDDERERWLRKWGLTLGDLDRALLAGIDRKLGVGATGQTLGAATAGRFRKYSKACVRTAVGLGLIPTDPWPPNRQGRSRRKANRVAQEVDIRTLPDPGTMGYLLAALLQRSQPFTGRTWNAMSAVGYYAGLRPSETIMLRRRAVHLPNLPAGGWGAIEVVEADDGYDNSADPKTGNRVVPIPPALVLILWDFLRERPTAPDSLLFRTKTGTRPTLASWRRALRRACAEINVPRLTPYDLRHACATTWLQAGVPLGEAARRLGHSVQTLVAHYIQALAGDESVANERIESALGTPIPRASREQRSISRQTA